MPKTVLRLVAATALPLALVSCSPPSPDTAETAAPPAPQEPAAPAPSPSPKPLVPAAIEIPSQPLQTVAGRPIQPAPSVRILTESGEPVPGVQVSVAPGHAAFTANSTTTATTGPNGTAEFPALTIEKAGNAYTLVFSAAGLPPATSAQFNIRFAPPRHLTVATQPAASKASKPIAGPPSVLVTDSFGNPVPRITVTASAGKAALSGQTKATTDESGMAVFDKLIVPRKMENTVLEFDAAAAGVPNAQSTPFRIR